MAEGSTRVKVHMGMEAPAAAHPTHGAGPLYETTVDSFHSHLFNPSLELTDSPKGYSKGHRHEILRNEDGYVTGIGEAEGHVHRLPEWVIGYLAEQHPHNSYMKKKKGEPEHEGDEMEGEMEDEKEMDDEMEKMKKRKHEPLYTVRGVEIFRVGKWNGDSYSRADLDEIVNNFPKVGFQVPVKLGHKEISGGPAYGWVERIRRAGDKLVADFRDLPEKLWNAVKARRFDSVSSEIFWNLERNGKKFKRVLKAVALLGGETPAVSGLKPLRAVVHSLMPPDGGFDRVGSYAFKIAGFTGAGNISQHRKEGETMDGNEELQARIDKIQEQIDEASAKMADALDKVESESKEEAQQATAALKEARAEIKALQEELNGVLAEMKTFSESKGAEIKALKEQVSGLTTKISDMAEVRRKERVKQKVDAVPIPALKRYMEPLYDLASSTAKTASYSAKDGEAAKDTPIEQVLDDMVGFMQGNALKLFKEISEANVQERADDVETFAGDPSAEVDKRAKKYMDEAKEKNYSKAVNHVLQADAALRKAYAGFTTGRAKH